MPTSTSIRPSAKSFRIRFVSAGLRKRETISTWTGSRPVARLEGVPVLLGEDRRRAEDERLLAVHGRSERGPDRDLGLAEADVAADEPVHRPRRLQILLDGFDRTKAWSSVSR